MRRKMNKRQDRAIFKRTASSIAKANLNSTNFRGGIRL